MTLTDTPTLDSIRTWLEAALSPGALGQMEIWGRELVLANPRSIQVVVGGLIALLGVMLTVQAARRARPSDGELVRGFAAHRQAASAGINDEPRPSAEPARAPQPGVRPIAMMPKAPAYLLPELPDGAGQDLRAAVPLARSMVRIGRHEENDIRFRHKTVHRYHAVVHRTPDGDFVITDLSGLSGNGIYVNGARVEQTPLRSGDLVELGEIRLRFQDARVAV